MSHLLGSFYCPLRSIFLLLSTSRSSRVMADRYPNYQQLPHRPPNRLATAISAILQRLQSHAPPDSTHLLGLLTLLISGTILLLLTGITVTTSAIGFILFLPIIIISSPIWIPVVILATGFLSFCGFAVGSVAVGSWLYRYIRGMHPPGSDRVDYARTRIYDTAAHVKDYAREYGGYLQSKVKDAAPSA